MNSPTMKIDATSRGRAVLLLWRELAALLEAWLPTQEPVTAVATFATAAAMLRTIVHLEPSWLARAARLLNLCDGFTDRARSGALSSLLQEIWAQRTEAAAELVAFIRSADDRTLADLPSLPRQYYLARVQSTALRDPVWFLRLDGTGVTTDFGGAARFAAEEAIAWIRLRPRLGWVALPCIEVDAMAPRRSACPRARGAADGCGGGRRRKRVMNGKTLKQRIRAAVDALGGSMDAALREAREQGRIEAVLEIDRLQADLVKRSRGARHDAEVAVFTAAYRAYTDAVRVIEAGLSREGQSRLIKVRLAAARAGVTSRVPDEQRPS